MILILVGHSALCPPFPCPLWFSLSHFILTMFYLIPLHTLYGFSLSHHSTLLLRLCSHKRLKRRQLLPRLPTPHTAWFELQRSRGIYINHHLGVLVLSGRPNHGDVGVEDHVLSGLSRPRRELPGGTEDDRRLPLGVMGATWAHNPRKLQGHLLLLNSKCVQVSAAYAQILHLIIACTWPLVICMYIYIYIHLKSVPIPIPIFYLFLFNIYTYTYIIRIYIYMYTVYTYIYICTYICM